MIEIVVEKAILAIVWAAHGMNDVILIRRWSKEITLDVFDQLAFFDRQNQRALFCRDAAIEAQHSRRHVVIRVDKLHGQMRQPRENFLRERIVARIVLDEDGLGLKKLGGGGIHSCNSKITLVPVIQEESFLA